MPHSKRPYIAPALLRHGDLAGITQGGSGSKQSDKTSIPISSSDRVLKRDVRVVADAVARLRAL